MQIGVKTEGDVITFPNGATYNSTTGVATTLTTDLIFPFNKLTVLHKSGGGTIGLVVYNYNGGHAVFSWQYRRFGCLRRKTKNFRRGLILAGIGIAIALAVLILSQLGGGGMEGPPR